MVAGNRYFIVRRLVWYRWFGFWVVRIVRCWRTKNSGGRRFTGPSLDNDEVDDDDDDDDDDEDEDGVEVFTVSSRQCSRTAARISLAPPPSIHLDTLSSRIDTRPEKCHCASSGCRLRQISQRFRCPAATRAFLSFFLPRFFHRVSP